MSTTDTVPVSPARRGWTAYLRWLVPIAFLALVGALVWHGVDEFDLPQIQRTLLQVPTLPALGVGALALVAVAFTGLVDVVIARWLGLPMPAGEMLRLAFVANSLVKAIAAFAAGGLPFARPLAGGVLAIDAALLLAWALSA